MAVDTGLLPPRYRNPERIGSGGMGNIFAATDEVLGRRVAVKVLAERYARDEAIRQRFTREALAAARLSGEPGAVTIYDVGDWQGRPYIVMEYVRGGSLEERLRTRGAHPPAQALDWLEQAAHTLDAAHRHGVVHRDVKPANLLLDDRGQVHIADFGIASAAGLDSMTLTGTVLGTAAEFVADLRDALARAAGVTANLGWVPPSPLQPVSARGRSRLLPALLLLAAAAAGAIIAVLLTSGGGHKGAKQIVTKRVTGPAGVTTVTVTRQQTVTTSAAPPPPPVAGSDGHSLNDRGYQLIQQGNFAGAIPLLQQAVQKLTGTGPADPYEAYANYNLGYALYRSGRCSEAVPYLQRAQQLEPERHEPRQLLKRAEHCS